MTEEQEIYGAEDDLFDALHEYSEPLEASYEKQHKPRLPWTDTSKEDLLERLHYRIDLVNWKLFSLNPFHYGKVLYQTPKASASRPDLAGSIRQGVYLTYFNIIKAAMDAGVVPELLVDEAYYYNKCGMAPYRVCFALMRTGKYKSLTHFYQYIETSTGYKPGRRAFLGLLQGMWGKNPHLRLWVIQNMCRLAEVPMSLLFTPYRRHGKEPVFSQLATLTGALGQAELAVLAGFARLLATRKPVSLELTTDLLNWLEETRAKERKTRGKK